MARGGLLALPSCWQSAMRGWAWTQSACEFVLCSRPRRATARGQSRLHRSRPDWDKPREAKAIRNNERWVAMRRLSMPHDCITSFTEFGSSFLHLVLLPLVVTILVEFGSRSVMPLVVTILSKIGSRTLLISCLLPSVVDVLLLPRGFSM